VLRIDRASRGKPHVVRHKRLGNPCFTLLSGLRASACVNPDFGKFKLGVLEVFCGGGGVSLSLKGMLFCGLN